MQDGRRRGRAGFTLIELLAVIIILSILAYFLITNVTGAQKSTQASLTRARATQLGGAISWLVDDQGDAPRSSLPAELGLPPNNDNLGSECLYLALCADGAPGSGKFEDAFSNTDGDSLAKRPEGFEVTTLFELCDLWGNPYAYFHHKDYGREDRYVTITQEGETVTSSVRALKNPKTGRYYEARGYQLISAGLDGVFGPDAEGEVDDIYSFKVDP
jgi:prepilin-type N-terminal cleavage/methylation domain-containing protein